MLRDITLDPRIADFAAEFTTSPARALSLARQLQQLIDDQVEEWADEDDEKRSLMGYSDDEKARI